MPLVRRSARPVAESTPAPQDVGVLTDRRVERVDSPGEPYWYFWTTTNREAISKLVNAFRGRPFKDTEFHVVPEPRKRLDRN